MLVLFKDMNGKGCITSRSHLHCSKQDHMGASPVCLYGVVADIANSFPIVILPSLFIWTVQVLAGESLASPASPVAVLGSSYTISYTLLA